MKQKFVLIAFLAFFKFSGAQVVCIQCYHQTDSISSGVTNLLQNGSFENNNCPVIGANSVSFCPNSQNYACDIASWTCTGGGLYTYCQLVDSVWTLVADGVIAVYMGNYYCNACPAFPGDTGCLNTLSCDTACLTKLGCTASDIPYGHPVNVAGYGGDSGLSLSQVVNGLTIGGYYVLEFWVGGEGGGGYFENDGLFAVNVGFGDTLLLCQGTAIGTTNPGIRYLVEFRATSTSHTIKFTNWGHICSSCTEPIFDDAKLYPISQLSATVPSCCIGVPVNIITDKTIMCNGDSTVICADSGFVSYLWSNGDSGKCITTAVPGNYYVTATSTAGCPDTSNTVGITVYPPTQISITVYGDTLTVNNANNIQWFRNDTALTGATSDTYITNIGGNYTVQIIDSNGCPVISNPVLISGIANVEAIKADVYPNPNTTGKWYLEVGTTLVGNKVEIFNDEGKLVYQSEIKNQKSEISLNAAGGIYMMQIKASGNIIFRKLVKL